MAGGPDRRPIEPEALVRAFELARLGSGAGERAARVTPGQRLDLHRVVAALRTPGGAAEEGADVEVWLAYLAPVLAESGPAKNLLRSVLAELAAPERADPEGGNSGLGGTTTGGVIVDPPGDFHVKPWSARAARWLRRQRVGLAALALMAGLAGLALWFVGPEREPPAFKPAPGDVASIPRQIDGTGSGGSTPEAQASRAFDEALQVAMDAIADPAFMAVGLTPRRLVGAYVLRDPHLGTPDTLVIAVLRGWPIPPDVPLTPDANGVLALRRLTAEVAGIKSSMPRVLFEDRIADRASPIDPRRLAGTATGPLAAAALPGLEAWREAAAAAPRPWSRWWLCLAALPFCVYLIHAGLSFRLRRDDVLDGWLRREPRALAPSGPGTGDRLPSGGLAGYLPEPVVARQSLRRLTRYRPAPGRRLDARRSVQALLRHAGFADPIMSRVQRTVHYLVIVQRWQANDHERARVRGLVDKVATMGLPVSVYDYERDLLTVTRAVGADGRARDEGIHGRDEVLRIPALRDLHPDARLVLVTDGRDLVDRVAGCVRGSVVTALFFWRERAVLTPVPVADWGDVEYVLSRDLDLPLGRTTQDPLGDLARAFAPTRGLAPHRRELRGARGVPGPERIVTWWNAVKESYGPGVAAASRGPHLSPDRPLFATDLEPERAIVQELIEDLRRWLGPRGFLWHAACAIYPQLRVDLTLHIGRSLRAGPHPEAPVVFRDTAADRRTFERMAALPWFRNGRMPEWLRREVLAALDPPGRQRAVEIFGDLFRAPPKPDKPGPLAIWFPRTGALQMPPDGVMVTATLAEERRATLRRYAGRAVIRRMAGVAALVAIAGAIAAWLAPDFASSPHPVGAWFPLLVFVCACLVLAVAFAALARRVARPPNPPGPAPPRPRREPPSPGPPRTGPSPQQSSRPDPLPDDFTRVEPSPDVLPPTESLPDEDPPAESSTDEPPPAGSSPDVPPPAGSPPDAPRPRELDPDYREGPEPSRFASDPPRAR